MLLLDGRGKKIHLRNGVVTLRNALGLHALPERIGDNRVLNKQQQHTNVVTMLHVRKMALVDPRLLKSLRENPTPLPDAIDTALRDLDAENDEHTRRVGRGREREGTLVQSGVATLQRHDEKLARLNRYQS